MVTANQLLVSRVSSSRDPRGRKKWKPETDELITVSVHLSTRLSPPSQDAPAAEVKKAYRRLSLSLHPDKNKDEDAESQFRQVRPAGGAAAP